MTSTAPVPVLTADPDTFAAAVCAQRWGLWCPAEGREEPQDHAYRTARAVAGCRRCPCLGPCADLLATIPAHARDGVWAGHSYSHTNTRRNTA